MHKSSARMILLSLCFQGAVLIPALAQGGNAANGSSATPARTAVSPSGYVPAANTAYVPAMANEATVPGSRTATELGSSTAAVPGSSTAGVDSTNYILGPEDQITVRVFAADDIPDRPAQIANDGTVMLPMVGQVHAAGLTVDQLQKVLVTAYKKYFKDPQVTVQVNDFRSQPVSVAGNVNSPGVVQLRGNRNLMEVISMAGGLRADAGDSVLITRNLSEGAIPVGDAFTDPTGKFSVAHINIRSIMSGKDPQGNIMIKPHDVITVPRARMIYVLGNVGRPGGYVLTDNESMSLTQAIALAGGWNTTASLSGARVLRATGGAEREQIHANVKKIMENKAPDLQMRPDDILYVPNSFGKEMTQQGIQSAIGVGTGILIWR
jgi:polysaccharide biosynthesis/export protein